MSIYDQWRNGPPEVKSYQRFDFVHYDAPVPFPGLAHHLMGLYLWMCFSWDDEIDRLTAASTFEPNIQLEIETNTCSVRVVNRYLVPLLSDQMFFDEHPDAC